MGERSLADWLGGAQPGDDDDPAGADPAGAGEASGPLEPGEPGEEPWEPAPRGRARRLWLLALVPWIAVVLALALLQSGTVEEAAGHNPEPQPDDPGGAGAGGDTVGRTPEPAAPAPRLQADEAAGTTAAADAAALAAVHLAVTGSEAGTERYVELAAVERRAAQPGNVLVITVLAVVLDGEQGTWTGRRAARFAVPVRSTAGAPRLLGPPWPLPAPDLDPRERPAGEPDATAEGAARRALAAAGYDEVEIESVDRIADGLLRVAGTAVAPGESANRAVEVWVGEEPEPAVLGLVDEPDANQEEEP